MALTFAMIGMFRKNRYRPEQLLSEHCAHEQMRPGRRAKGEQLVRARALLKNLETLHPQVKGSRTAPPHGRGPARTDY